MPIPTTAQTVLPKESPPFPEEEIEPWLISAQTESLNDVYWDDDLLASAVPATGWGINE